MSNPDLSALDSLAPLAAECERLGVGLDGEARGRFARYVELLDQWNERASLTSIADPATLQRRLFGESIALMIALRESALAASAAPVRIVDIGAGGGFPALPMRIVQAALGLTLRVTLIEASERRCAFLRATVEALELPDVTVVNARAEDAGRDPALRASFELAVARAVAPLPTLVEYALPLLAPGGLLATPKGSRAVEELDDAARAIEELGGTALPSLELPLPPDAPAQRVLLVRRTGPVGERYPRRAGLPAKRPIR